jgi:hypothetical protein
LPFAITMVMTMSDTRVAAAVVVVVEVVDEWMGEMVVRLSMKGVGFNLLALGGKMSECGINPSFCAPAEEIDVP